MYLDSRSFIRSPHFIDVFIKKLILVKVLSRQVSNNWFYFQERKICVNLILLWEKHNLFYSKTFFNVTQFQYSKDEKKIIRTKKYFNENLITVCAYTNKIEFDPLTLKYHNLIHLIFSTLFIHIYFINFLNIDISNLWKENIL